MLRKEPQLSHLQWWISFVTAAACFCKLFLMGFLKTAGACCDFRVSRLDLQVVTAANIVHFNATGGKKKKNKIKSHLSHLVTSENASRYSQTPTEKFRSLFVIFERSWICTLQLFKLWNDCRWKITPLTSVNINTIARCIFTSHLVNWFSSGTFAHTIPYRGRSRP